MRIAFTRFPAVLPAVCEPQKKTGELTAHALRDTRTCEQGQAARQIRRVAAGSNDQRIGKDRSARGTSSLACDVIARSVLSIRGWTRPEQYGTLKKSP